MKRETRSKKIIIIITELRRARSLIVIITDIKGKSEIWHGSKHHFCLSVAECMFSSCVCHHKSGFLLFLRLLSGLIKRSWAAGRRRRKEKRKKNPYPPKPPHVPFSCLRLLRSHDPLTEASPPVEYHMFPVKPNFFFFSSLKGQAFFFFFLSFLPSPKAPPPPSTSWTQTCPQNVSDRWGFELICCHKKRGEEISQYCFVILRWFPWPSEIEFMQPLNCGQHWRTPRVRPYSSKD